MLKCGGCRVARFYSTDHQKMASKSVASGGHLWTGRHKDICGLLGKWSGVEKDGVSHELWLVAQGSFGFPASSVLLHSKLLTGLSSQWREEAARL